jgi:hypothetical protein
MITRAKRFIMSLLWMVAVESQLPVENAGRLGSFLKVGKKPGEPGLK